MAGSSAMAANHGRVPPSQTLARRYRKRACAGDAPAPMRRALPAPAAATCSTLRVATEAGQDRAPTVALPGCRALAASPSVTYAGRFLRESRAGDRGEGPGVMPGTDAPARRGRHRLGPSQRPVRQRDDSPSRVALSREPLRRSLQRPCAWQAARPIHRQQAGMVAERPTRVRCAGPIRGLPDEDCTSPTASNGAPRAGSPRDRWRDRPGLPCRSRRARNGGVRHLPCVSVVARSDPAATPPFPTDGAYSSREDPFGRARPASAHGSDVFLRWARPQATGPRALVRQARETTACPPRDTSTPACARHAPPAESQDPQGLHRQPEGWGEGMARSRSTDGRRPTPRPPARPEPIASPSPRRVRAHPGDATAPDRGLGHDGSRTGHDLRRQAVDATDRCATVPSPPRPRRPAGSSRRCAGECRSAMPRASARTGATGQHRATGTGAMTPEPTCLESGRYRCCPGVDDGGAMT